MDRLADLRREPAEVLSYEWVIDSSLHRGGRVATRDFLVELMARVGSAWTGSPVSHTSERVAESVERVRELWHRIVQTIPTSSGVPSTNHPWSSFMDQSELEVNTDRAVVRWERFIEGMQQMEAPSEADLVAILDELVQTGQSACKELLTAYSTVQDQVRPAFQDERLDLTRVADELQAEASRLSIIKTAQDVEEVRDSTRVAAGEIATGDLAQHFEKYRKSERIQAEVLRGLGAALIIVTVCVLAQIIPGDRSTAEVFQRAAFSVPLFAVAAYLAAESARHRRASQWAATMRVQLLSVDLFTKPMDPAEAATVRMVLAKRAFGDVPMLGAGADQKEEAAMPVSLQAVLERLLVELRSKPDKSS